MQVTFDDLQPLLGILGFVAAVGATIGGLGDRWHRKYRRKAALTIPALSINARLRHFLRVEVSGDRIHSEMLMDATIRKRAERARFVASIGYGIAIAGALGLVALLLGATVYAAIMTEFSES